MSFGFAGVAAITVICSLARRTGRGGKDPGEVAAGDLRRHRRRGRSGGSARRSRFPASDILGAIAVGIVSGFSASGG